MLKTSGQDELTLAQDEWEQRKIFSLAGKTMLGFFFLILLANLLLNLHFSSRNSELSYEYSIKARALDEMNGLRSEVASKKTFLNKIGWEGKNQIPFYADRLAATVPSGIQWTLVDFSPLNEKLSKQKKKQIFSAGEILVRGTCQAPLLLNDWLKVLEQLEWVDEITNRQYHFDRKTKLGQFEFSLINKN